MNFFQRNFQRTTPDDVAVERARRDTAYNQGRLDARSNVDEPALIREHDAATRKAYERGRRDERARHPRPRSHPVLGTVLVLAAAAGAFVIYLGVQQGSFANGGSMVDQHIQNAAQGAQQAGRNAVDKAGDALENAGQNLKHSNGNG
ncbi:MAG TPA: hypothetical protein VGI95_14145 [Caulobacteraceae bacterium]|jgi:hypothetical protein